MKKREEIDNKYKWDLSSRCLNDNDFDIRLENLHKKNQEILAFQNTLKDDDKLFECLEFDSLMGQKYSVLLNYCFNRQNENSTEQNANEMVEKGTKIVTEYDVNASFVVPEICKFSESKIKGLMSNPKFKNYNRFFEGILRHKKHSLSVKEEKILSATHEFSSAFSDIFFKFDSADIRFEDVVDSSGAKHELNHSNAIEYFESKDPVLREDAYKKLNGEYGKYINFLSTNYLSHIKADSFYANVRKYPSSLYASIYNEEASEKVYKTLIQKVHENVGLFYDYMELKRKLLKQNKIKISDCFAPVVDNVAKTYTYDEAIEIVKQAVKPLGEEYVGLIQLAKDEKWIDVYPNEGKDTGAYCSGAYGVHPVVLTNFTGNLNSVFTLAHELGHAMHSHFSDRQPFQTHDHTIFVAEVASTVNEMLLFNYLLSKSATTEEKMYLYDRLFTEVKGTIYRQTMFAEFEEIVHEKFEKKEPLSKDKLCSIYYDLNKFYFGEKVELLDEVQFEWARIPHFYTSFYVYKYATGLITALSLSNDIFNKKENAKERYLNFLSSGSSLPPVELLKNAGFNLEKPESFDKIFDYLKDKLNEWKLLIK